MADICISYVNKVIPSILSHPRLHVKFNQCRNVWITQSRKVFFSFVLAQKRPTQSWFCQWKNIYHFNQTLKTWALQGLSLNENWIFYLLYIILSWFSIEQYIPGYFRRFTRNFTVENWMVTNIINAHFLAISILFVSCRTRLEERDWGLEPFVFYI